MAGGEMGDRKRSLGLRGAPHLVENELLHHSVGGRCKVRGTIRGLGHMCRRLEYRQGGPVQVDELGGEEELEQQADAGGVHRRLEDKAGPRLRQGGVREREKESGCDGGWGGL
eukprot:scaffold23030_cov79-Isochrysis_galbana.AAC.1